MPYNATAKARNGTLESLQLFFIRKQFSSGRFSMHFSGLIKSRHTAEHGKQVFVAFIC